jgi:ribosomal protein S12 methylthiotransferase accessory factor
MLISEATTACLPKRYKNGTHRLATPDETLARVEPHLGAMLVTRCADVTGLDRVGIPVFCAIRPMGEILQLANGKGTTSLNARISALMEALEHYHAENPGAFLRRTSYADLQRKGHVAINPTSLPLCDTTTYFSPDYIIDWVMGKNIINDDEVWVPACAAYFRPPTLFALSTNGLASGNHLIEATLHGLYEVIERDAISRLFVGGTLRLTRANCRVIDPDTIHDQDVNSLVIKLQQAQIKLVLIWIESCVAMNTFWAILLDQNPYSASTIVHFGSGAHLSCAVAAVRAITEAAQARLTYIHGVRENIVRKIQSPSMGLINKVYSYFDHLACDRDWRRLPDFSDEDLAKDYRRILTSLCESGYQQVYRVDMTRAPFDIPVVKIFVPGLQIKSGLF